MKEYHYGTIHQAVATQILNDWATQGWEVQWINRNKDTAQIDILLVREAK